MDFVAGFLILLLLIDAILLYQLRDRLRLGGRAKFVLGLGYIVVSIGLLTWQFLVPGVAPMYTCLGWIFLTSLPVAWVGTNPEGEFAPARTLRQYRLARIETSKQILCAQPTDAEQSVLREAGVTDPILAAISTDLSLDGNYRRCLVAATQKALACVGETDGIVFHEPLERMESITANSLVGGGRLEVKLLDGETRIVARFSNSNAREFMLLAKRIQDFLGQRKKCEEYEEKREAGELEEDDEPPEEPKLDFENLEEDGPNFCPKCGRRLGDNTKICPKCVNKRQALLRILKLAMPYWTKLALLAGLMIVGSMAQLVPPYLTKSLVDDVFTGRMGSLLFPLVALFALMLVLQAALSMVRARISLWVGATVTRDLRAKCFHHLQTLSLGYFDQQKVGGLMSRVHNDTGRLQGFLTEGIQYTVINLLLLVGIATMLLVLNWKLGLLVLLPSPLMVVFSYWFWHRVFKLFRRLMERYSRFTAFLNDTLNGVRVVKAFGQESQEMKRFDTHNQELFSSLIHAERMWVTFHPILGLLMQSGMIMVWFFGGMQVLAGELTIGTLMAYISYLWMFYGPLQLITRLNDWLTRSMAAAERVFEILDAEPDVKDSDSAIEMPQIVGKVSFKSANFGYDPLKPVLKDVDLEVAPGEMIGLVGHSGAGKSTAINLICRLYDVQTGSICIDDIDVKDIRQESLRKQIGVVLQETYLFNGTIAENIAYANADASREEIMAASLAANAHEFVMKRPDGYDSQVGERGAALSGGEKQRIAIARAVLHNPRILILDEATASVDTETEQQIQQALSRLIQGRTTFAIAHRLSTLRNADRLVVLENGKIAECGTHQELLEKDGIYAKLVKVQSELSTVMAVTS